MWLFLLELVRICRIIGRNEVRKPKWRPQAEAKVYYAEYVHFMYDLTIQLCGYLYLV